MKPINSVITSIYVGVRYVFKFFVIPALKNKKARASIIAPHVLYAFFFFATIAPTFATSGILFVTHDFIVLGSDSTLKRANGAATTGFFTVCKIAKEGNIFYFPVGEYFYRSLKFNVYDISRQAVIKA